MNATDAGANLADLLVKHPAPDDTVVLHGPDGDITTERAREEVDHLATRLTADGAGTGVAVALRMPDGVQAVVAMMAIWRSGAVLVPISDRSTDAETAAALEVTRPALLVTADGVDRLEDPRTYDEGVAFVTWTSGTTGRPKAVLHTHDEYLELIDRVLAPIAAKRAERGLTAPPTPNLIPVALAQNAGIYNVLFGLRAGAPLVIMGRFDTERFAHLVREFGIRSTVLPPAAITMLADDRTISDLKPLQYVRSVTAPLSPVAARRFNDRFAVTVLNGYGQAEVGEVIGWSADDARRHPDKVGAAGRPHDGVEVKVVDDGVSMPDGVVGELLVRPPRHAVGYVAGERLDDRIDDEGFIRTGDIARIDEDGFVWIEGRKGEVINRGGNKVFPEQVEEVLRLHDEVRDAVVVAAPDERLGEIPVAFVVGRVMPTELEHLCRDHLSAYKVPVAFAEIDAIPRNDAGKVLRRELADRAAGLIG